jgi:Zn finger protein HypA/HybF involved in hydrogenase expression
MKLRKYTLTDLTDAIKTSVSVRECLTKLNVAPQGGNYAIFHKAVKHFNLDTSHFTGKNLSGRKLPARRKSIDEYLTKQSSTQSFKLKRYLLESSIFEAKCVSCGLFSWLNEPIPLELDHIDGDNTNNELSNLRLLCPNCHAKTPTYRGKNKRK